ncbi:MAG: hypothetical protein RL180_1511 [Pseudomonadota bacterium]
MKLLKLEVYNLASLAAINDQPQVVDFASAPLVDAGLSAIVGPTGAGKSTLLDALCLALFDEVPRLRTASHGQAGVVKDGADQSLAFGDKRNMLTRGTALGYAKVTFASHDGRQYRAEWQVQRARRRIDGALQKVNRSVIELPSGTVLASQKTECAQLIQHLIGMTFDQFTRAVLLAQSEFGAFLKANDNERAALLECLTDTNIYSRLGVLAHQKSKAAQEALKEIQGALGFSQPLAPSDRQQLDDQWAVLTQDKQQAQTDLQHWQHIARWQQQQTLFAEQCQQHGQQVRQAQQALDDASPQYTRWAHCKAVAPIRPVWVQKTAIAAQLAQLQQHITVQQQQVQAAQHAQSIAQQHWHTAQQANTQQADASALQYSLLEQAVVLEVDRDRLRHSYQQHKKIMQEGQQQLDRLLNEQQQLNSQYDAQQQRITQQQQHLSHTVGLQAFDTDATDKLTLHLRQAAQARQTVQQQQPIMQAAQQAVQQATDALDTAQTRLLQQQQHTGDEASLLAAGQYIRAQMAQVHRQQGGAYQVQQAVTALVGHQQRDQQLTQQLAALDVALLHSSQQRQQALHQHQSAEQQHQQLEAVWLRQCQLSDHSVTHLRSQLQPDQPCPVCGSAEHPYVTQSMTVLAAVLQESQQAVERARAVLDACQRERQQVEQQCLTQQTEHQLLHREHAQCVADQQQAWHHSVQAATALGITLSETHALSSINHYIAQQETHLTQLTAAQQQHDQHTQQRQQHQDDYQQCLSQQQQAEQQVQHLQQASAQAQQSADLHESIFLPNLTPADQQAWQQAAAADNLPHHAETLVELLQQRKDHRDTLQQALEQIKEIGQQQQLHSQKIDTQQAKLHDHQHQRQQIEAEGHAVNTQLTERLAQAQPPAHSAAQWKNQLQQHDQAHADALSLAQQQLHDLDKQLQQASFAYERSQHDALTLTQAHEALVQQWQAWQTQHSDLHAATLDAVLDMDDASIDALQQHCQDLLDQHKQAQHQWAWIQQQAAAHQQQQPSDCPADSATTQQALLTQQQRVEHVQQAWAVVFGQINEDQRRQQQAAQLGQALADAQREQARWHKLASPIGCATGAVFRKIAQGYQLDVLLAQANVQLEQLSRRYRLRRADDTLGLLVIDRDMGDECRSVHSLSGGESFLVSLALALGLASMASGLLRIESLFIDEGFGTLDPDSLQLVMDALDQLQAQGRKVIVITHVQDMQERIPVQIQVTRTGLGHSRVTVTDRQRQLP